MKMNKKENTTRDHLIDNEKERKGLTSLKRESSHLSLNDGKSGNLTLYLIPVFLFIGILIVYSSSYLESSSIFFGRGSNKHSFESRKLGTFSFITNPRIAPPQDSSTCNPSLIIIRHGEDLPPNDADSSLPTNVSPVDLSSGFTSKSATRLDNVGLTRAQVFGKYLDQWLHDINTCVTSNIPQVSTIKPEQPKQFLNPAPTNNPFYTINPYRNAQYQNISSSSSSSSLQTPILFFNEYDTRTFNLPAKQSRIIVSTKQDIWEGNHNDAGLIPGTGSLFQQVAHSKLLQKICFPDNAFIYVFTNYDGVSKKYLNLRTFISPKFTPIRDSSKKILQPNFDKTVEVLKQCLESPTNHCPLIETSRNNPNDIYSCWNVDTSNAWK